MSKPIRSAAVPPVLPSLIAWFQDVPDPRGDRTKHPKVLDSLVISICTLLGCGESVHAREACGHAKFEWLTSVLA
jgi:hypothetical protein